MSADANQAASRLIDSAAQSLVDGLALLDATQTVVVWNRRAVELLQLPTAEILGVSAITLIERIAACAHAPERANELLRQALATRETQRVVEIEIDGAAVLDRQTQTIAAQFFLLCDSEANELGTGIVLRDVTRERAADAMKAQLLSTVSHELRTPLASIKGFATTLLRQDVKWDEATQRDFLHIIEDETNRLAEIIDNLLDMSQLEAGALRIVREPTQLRQLIREVMDEMRMRTEAHYFVVDLPADLPRVLVDPRRIRQVLTNLIGNAIKYAKGGQITVACEVDGAMMTVSVADQGDGIPPQFLDKIFERFFQVDGASTRRVGGSGLGLAISRGIVQAHGGTLWATSVIGQGSVFRFTVPLVENEALE